MPSGDEAPALSGTGVNGVPPAPPPGFPLSIDPSITPPRKIKDVRPVYPAAAQRAKVEGTVVIEITVGVNGRVADARVVRSIAGLDQAALDSVRGWEFTPALRNGVATPFVLPVSVSFTLGH